jgi:crossover junction endodeoxyribonuclease RuvC
MTRPRCILGIDPGISGAIAFYFPEFPERVGTEDMPIAGGDVDANTLSRRLTIMAPDICIMERVGAMPGQGVEHVQIRPSVRYRHWSCRCA